MTVLPRNVSSYTSMAPSKSGGGPQSAGSRMVARCNKLHINHLTIYRVIVLECKSRLLQQCSDNYAYYFRICNGSDNVCVFIHVTRNIFTQNGRMYKCVFELACADTIDKLWERINII